MTLALATLCLALSLAAPSTEGEAPPHELFGTFEGRPKAVAWAEKGSVLVVATVESEVQGWDAKKGEHLWTHAIARGDQAKRDAVGAVTISGSGTVIVASSLMPTITIIGAKSGELGPSINTSSGVAGLVGLAPDAKKRWVWVVDEEGALLRGTLGAEVTRSVEVPGVRSVAAAGKLVALGTERGSIHVLDADKLGEKHAMTELGGPIVGVAFDTKAGHLAAVNGRGEARLWKLKKKAELVAELNGFQEEARCVTFDPKGKWVAVGGKYGEIRMWKTADGSELAVFRHSEDGPALCLAPSPDGKRLASVGAGKDLVLWDVSKLK